jgi:hypothetical protein
MVDVAGCHFVEVDDNIISVVVGELIHIMKGLLRAVVQIVFHTGIYRVGSADEPFRPMSHFLLVKQVKKVVFKA